MARVSSTYTNRNFIITRL
uniref:Uncharacterized protein n=1 Tax=Arundo donax TaxID=35708 RepID=A0A0A9BQY4_ARUDO